jgi:hypothetical protein
MTQRKLAMTQQAPDERREQTAPSRRRQYSAADLKVNRAATPRKGGRL